MKPEDFNAKYLFSSTPSGIFMPVNPPGVANRRKALSELLGVGPAVSWRLLSGQKATWQDVIEHLKKSDLRAVLNRLMCLSIECSKEELEDDTQKRLLYGLFGPKAEQLWKDAHQKLIRTGEASTLRFFFDVQLLNAARVAILFCDVRDTSVYTADLEALGIALLMITDLLDLPPDSGRDPDGMGRFLRVNRLAQYKGKPAHRLARAHLLHTSAETAGQIENEEFSKRMEALTGLTPELVMTAGLSVWSIMLSFSSKDIVNGDVYISRDCLFGGYSFSETEIDRMWNLASIRLDEIKRELAETWDDGDPNPFDLLPFQKKPLVEIEDHVYCPSIQLLYGRFTEGLHHFQISDNQDDNPIYFNLLGYKFEKYVDDLIYEVRGGRGAIAGYDRDPIGDPKGQIRKYGDGAIAYPNEAILIEVKSGFLDAEATSRGHSGTFERYFNKAIAEGAEQLDGLLRRAEAGELSAIGVDSDAMYRYYPILILQQPFFEVTLYEKLRAKLQEKDILTHKKAAPIQVIDIGSFEYLIAQVERGTDILSIIKGKSMDETWRDLDMTRYLYDRHGILNSCNYLEKRYANIFNVVLDQFRNRRRRE